MLASFPGTESYAQPDVFSITFYNITVGQINKMEKKIMGELKKKTKMENRIALKFPDDW